MTTKPKATRDGFGDGLIELGTKNPEVVVLTADLAESTRTLGFSQQFPERFIEVGVAEQNLMGISAGLALSGKIPFAASYAVFSPGRNWDQLRVSVCYSQANVKIASSHTGLAVGPDGATHQALEDIAMTRVLPNLIVIVPCDYEEAKKATLAVVAHRGPAYLRLTRDGSPALTSAETPFEIGKANILREGKDLTIIGCGPILAEAMAAADELKKDGIDVEVINNHSIKPMDKKTLTDSAKKTKHMITIEDHQMAGGMGSAVCELFADEQILVPIKRMGVQDQFGQSGKPAELWQKYGLSAEHIVRAVRDLLKK